MQTRLKSVADANRAMFANVPGETRRVREKITTKKRIDEYEGGY